MIALILNVAVLSGLASGDAVPRYNYNQHHQNQQIHVKEIINSNSAEMEAPEAKRRQPTTGLLLVTQNPIGLCREDRSKCGCFKGLSEKMTGNGDPYPLWTVETLWQGAVSRSRTQTLSVCMEPMVAVPSALIAFHGLSDDKQRCLRSVWPPLDKAESDCTEVGAIIEEGTIQGNCALDYEHFRSLVPYYSQVAQLYEIVNGWSDSCHADCGNGTIVLDARGTKVPQLHGTAEKIHLALTKLGLTNDKPTMIDPTDIKKYFDFNVYMGCMISNKSQGLNSWIITRIGFCFQCPRGNQPCDEPEPVDCWTDAKHPPSSVPWFARNKDLPCYTAKQKVCYCGFDRYADCTC